MDRRWVHGVLFTPEYIRGVKSFMNFIGERFPEAEQILCPCTRCINQHSLHQNEVERHLLLNGMSTTYTRWIDHGESIEVHVLDEPLHQDGNANSLANKYQNEQPNALDIFKDCHYSKKKGFTPAVQSAIVEMEDKINAPVNDGEEPKDVTDAVSEVLLQKTKKNSFLVNVGMKSSSVSGDNAESLQELEAELVVEKQTSSELRELVKTQQVQMEDMMKKFEESEATKARQNEEFMKKQAETDALIRSLMSMIPASVLTR